MTRFAASSILSILFSLPAYAVDMSITAVQDQQSDQTRCVQQRITQCAAQCNLTVHNNCTQLCEENAKNECRQAGE